LPDVVVIRVTQTAIELLLMEDDPDALPPFRSTGARTWRLEAMPSIPPDDDMTDPFPGLVGVGVDEDALVLLNLEAVGSVSLVDPRKAPSRSSELLPRNLRSALSPRDAR
jgi:hypothetical protein